MQASTQATWHLNLRKVGMASGSSQAMLPGGKSEARLAAPEGPEGFQGCRVKLPCTECDLDACGLHTDRDVLSSLSESMNSRAG